MKKTPFLIVVSGLFVMIFASNPVYAYLDPGTGSMIVQAIIGMVVAVSVSLGIFRKRVKAFLKRLFKRGSDQNNNPSSHGN